MKQNFGTMQFKIKSNNVEETLLYIESYWKENVEQGYPFSAEFLNKRFARTYAKYQKQHLIFNTNNSGGDYFIIGLIWACNLNNSTAFKRSRYSKNFGYFSKRNYVSIN